MINIRKDKNIITISGHAGSGDFGKDIVCASASSIVYTTVNAIEKLRPGSIELEDNKDMIIKIVTNDEIVDNLIINMFELFKELEKQYPKNVRVKES